MTGRAILWGNIRFEGDSIGPIEGRGNTEPESWIFAISFNLCYPSPSSTVHIDCITVSTLPVKATIDDHIQQLFDALLSALRRAISSHFQVTDHYYTRMSVWVNFNTCSVPGTSNVLTIVALFCKSSSQLVTLMYMHTILLLYCWAKVEAFGNTDLFK